MDRRSFLAFSAASLTGLVVPTTGVLAVPRHLVLQMMGSCSFCKKEPLRIAATAGNRDGTVRICDQCLRLCLDIIAEDDARPAPPPAPPAPRGDWRRSLGESGYSPDDIDRLLVGGPTRRRLGGELSCSFCDRSQRAVRKLIAGPKVHICDHCVADGGSLLLWSGIA